eukprot:6188067-Pleurochrysis_carterae.AAC.9
MGATRIIAHAVVSLALTTLHAFFPTCPPVHSAPLTRCDGATFCFMSCTVWQCDPCNVLAISRFQLLRYSA